MTSLRMAAAAAAEMVRRFAADAYCNRAREYLEFRASTGSSIEASTWGPLPFLFGGLRRAHVVDVGCGAGSKALEQLDIESYLGFDLSPGLLANHVFSGQPWAELRACDLEAERPSIPDAVDLVTAILSLNYIADPSEVLDWVRRDGRSFYIVVPSPAFDREHGEVQNGATRIRFLGFDLIYHSHSLDDLIALLGPCEELEVKPLGPKGLFSEPPYMLLHGRW